VSLADSQNQLGNELPERHQEEHFPSLGTAVPWVGSCDNDDSVSLPPTFIQEFPMFFWQIGKDFAIFWMRSNSHAQELLVL
jgi:hypothetical protein